MAYKNVADKRAASKRQYQAEPRWKKIERIVATRLRTMDVEAKVVGRCHSPFDIITAGSQRIEVKSAEFKSRRKCWVVSIARVGKMKEDAVDHYVFVLSGHPALGFRRKDKRLYLIVKSPVRMKQIVVTMHRLLTRWRDNINAWGLIIDEERRRKS
jgi:hypothetical protein